MSQNFEAAFPKGCEGVSENRLCSPTWPLSFSLIFLDEIWGWKEDTLPPPSPSAARRLP